MPRIVVVSHLGRAPQTPLQASLASGSVIVGRAPDCSLVLPDPERHVSRRQAEFRLGAGGASIVCLSAANPLLVNGIELRQGTSRRLVDGDQITIAGYDIRFDEEETASMAVVQSRGAEDDPFAALLGGDPFVASPRPETLRGESSLAESAHRESPPTGSFSANSPGSGSRLDLTPQENIDTLFGLDSGADPLAPGAPLSGSPRMPVGDRGGQAPAPVENLDPLAVFGAPSPEPVDAPMPDHDPAISSSFRLPAQTPAVVSWTSADFAANPPPAAAASLTALDVERIPSHAFEANRVDQREPPRTQPTDLVNSLNRSQRVAMLQARQGVGLDALAHAPTAAEPALLAALLQGLGLPELPRGVGTQAAHAQQLSPDLMRRIGEMLAEAVQGTVSMLQARTTLKQELRADRTRVGASDNNPLKFAPDGQAALQQMLSPTPVRGFMPAAPAMRDANEDLLAHQIAVVAGMRAALQGVIARFEPGTLERRLAPRAVLDTLVPMARQARLWELFTAAYSAVSTEAADDFHALFGREFINAYEEQIRHLADGKTGTHSSSGPAPPSRSPSSGREA